MFRRTKGGRRLRVRLGSTKAVWNRKNNKRPFAYSAFPERPARDSFPQFPYNHHSFLFTRWFHEMSGLLQSLRRTTTKATRSCAGSRFLTSTPAVYRDMPNFNRPGPPPLPAEDQKEFEELVRKAQAPLSGTSAKAAEGAGQLLDQDVKTFSADGTLLFFWTEFSFRRNQVTE